MANRLRISWLFSGLWMFVVVSSDISCACWSFSRFRTRMCYASSLTKRISRIRYLHLLVVKDKRCSRPSEAAVLGLWINLTFEFSRKSAWCSLLHESDFVHFREGGVSSSPLNMKDRGGATNLLLTGRDGASEIRSVRDSACVKWIIILAKFYRHFSEEKTKLEADWHNISHQMNTMKTRYLELRKKIDSLIVCSDFYL